MKTTWILAVSALTALFVGAAIAASAAEPETPVRDVSHAEAPATQAISLADVYTRVEPIAP